MAFVQYVESCAPQLRFKGENVPRILHITLLIYTFLYLLISYVTFISNSLMRNFVLYSFASIFALVIVFLRFLSQTPHLPTYSVSSAFLKRDARNKENTHTRRKKYAENGRRAGAREKGVFLNNNTELVEK